MCESLLTLAGPVVSSSGRLIWKAVIAGDWFSFLWKHLTPRPSAFYSGSRSLWQNYLSESLMARGPPGELEYSVLHITEEAFLRPKARLESRCIW